MTSDHRPDFHERSARADTSRNADSVYFGFPSLRALVNDQPPLPCPLFFVLTFMTFTSTTALADDDGCKPVIGAMTKQAVTPYHVYQSNTASGNSGKSRDSESINTLTMHYLKVDGKWSARPYDGKKNAADIVESMKSNKPTCTRIDEGTVDGQTATLYRAHNPGMPDNQIWISNSSGLPLQQIADTGSSHMTMHYVYTNVQPPANVQ